MACMQGALEDIVASPSLRQKLATAFFTTADWMRNDAENPHDAGRRHGAATSR